LAFIEPPNSIYEVQKAANLEEEKKKMREREFSKNFIFFFFSPSTTLKKMLPTDRIYTMS